MYKNLRWKSFFKFFGSYCPFRCLYFGVSGSSFLYIDDFLSSSTFANPFVLVFHCCDCDNPLKGGNYFALLISEVFSLFEVRSLLLGPVIVWFILVGDRGEESPSTHRVGGSSES